MSKYITDDTSDEAKDFLALVQAYEDAQTLLRDTTRKVEKDLYKCSDSGFHTPESVTSFKAQLSSKLSFNSTISEAKKKVSKASRNLDDWLTPFMVDILDSDIKEFVICGNYQKGVMLARMNKEYHTIHCSGHGTMRNQLSDYFQKLSS